MVGSIKRRVLALAASLVLLFVALIVAPGPANSATGTGAVQTAVESSAQGRAAKPDRPCRAFNRRFKLGVAKNKRSAKKYRNRVGPDRL